MRTYPSSLDGRTPAEILGRPFRTHLTQMHRSQLPSKTPSKMSPACQPGQMVWVLKRSQNRAGWVPGVITESNGVRCFDVRLESGHVMKNVSGDHPRLRFGEEIEIEPPQSSNNSNSFQANDSSPPKRSSAGEPRRAMPTSTPSTMAEAEDTNNLPDQAAGPPSSQAHTMSASQQMVQESVGPSTESSNPETPPTDDTSEDSVTNNYGNHISVTNCSGVIQEAVAGPSTVTSRDATLEGSPGAFGADHAVEGADNRTHPEEGPEQGTSTSTASGVSAENPFYGFPDDQTPQPLNGPEDQSPSRTSSCLQSPVNSPVPPSVLNSPVPSSGLSSPVTSSASKSQVHSAAVTSPSESRENTPQPVSMIVPHAKSMNANRGRGSVNRRKTVSPAKARIKPNMNTHSARDGKGRGRGDPAHLGRTLTRAGCLSVPPARFNDC